MYDNPTSFNRAFRAMMFHAVVCVCLVLGACDGHGGGGGPDVTAGSNGGLSAGQMMRNELDPNYVNVPAELVPERYQGKPLRYVEFKLTTSFPTIEVSAEFTLKPGGLVTDGESSYTGMDGERTSGSYPIGGTWSGGATGGDTGRLESLRITATDEAGRPFSLQMTDAMLCSKEVQGDRTIIHGLVTTGDCFIAGRGPVELDAMGARFELIYHTALPESNDFPEAE